MKQNPTPQLSAISAEPIAYSEGEFYAMDSLEHDYDELIQILRALPLNEKNTYQTLATRLNDFKTVTQSVDKVFTQNAQFLSNLQEGFRRSSQDVFFQSHLFRRARTWPEGYPADQLTMEAIYSDKSESKTELGKLLDRYFLSLKLATGLRSRISKLSELLDARVVAESGNGNWLSLACGSARELITVKGQQKIACVDYDVTALQYAQNLLLSSEGSKHFEFIKSNGLHFVSAEKNIEQFGQLTTIYSPGLFDYVGDAPLSKLLNGLYQSLAPGGQLIASFLDGAKYDTFDSHWLTKWNSLIRRSQDETLRILTNAGIPMNRIAVERDASGIGMFFIASK